MPRSAPKTMKNPWAEAAYAANYLRKGSPSRILLGVAPFERLNGKKPPLGHARAFGSPAHVAANWKKKKLDDRARIGIFVGFSARSKAYRIHMRDANNIEVRRDAKIDESKILDTSEGVVARGELDAGMQESDEESAEPDSCQEYAINFDKNSEDSAENNEETDVWREANADESRSCPDGERRAPSRCSPEAAMIVCAEPLSYRAALQAEDKNLWKSAMQGEYESLMKNGAWKLCRSPEGRQAIDC